MAETIVTSALKDDRHFTLADWRAWPEDECWELIGGTAWNLSPSPRVPHQRKTGDLYRRLGDFLDGNPCQPFIAPLDVFLSAADVEDSVVVPDVSVVCDPGKVADDGIHGAPDFVAGNAVPSAALPGFSWTCPQD